MQKKAFQLQATSNPDTCEKTLVEVQTPFPSLQSIWLPQDIESFTLLILIKTSQGRLGTVEKQNISQTTKCFPLIISSSYLRVVGTKEAFCIVIYSIIKLYVLCSGMYSIKENDEDSSFQFSYLSNDQ